MVEIRVQRPKEDKTLPIIYIAQRLNLHVTTIMGFLDRPEFRQFEIQGPYRRFIISIRFKEALKEAMKNKWCRLKSKRDYYKKVDLL